jgi:hypothetical protein
VRAQHLRHHDLIAGQPLGLALLALVVVPMLHQRLQGAEAVPDIDVRHQAGAGCPVPPGAEGPVPVAAGRRYGLTYVSGIQCVGS